MAIDHSGVDIALIAGADLSAKQYYLVDVATDGDVELAGDGAAVLGVLQNAPESGECAIVRINGTSKVVFSASVDPSTVVASDASGKVTAAAAEDIACGYCLVDGGGDGQIGTIALCVAVGEQNA